MTPAPPPADVTAPLAHADVIVLDYLAALWAESGDLSPQMRDERPPSASRSKSIRMTTRRTVG
jgi:hypothetical protein